MAELALGFDNVSPLEAGALSADPPQLVVIGQGRGPGLPC